MTSNQGNDTVGEYDATTGTAIVGWTSPSGLRDPLALAVSGNNLYVVSNFFSGPSTVGKYDATTGATIAGFTSPSGLHEPPLVVSGNNLYLVTDNTVGSYDATTGAAINANLITGLNGPDALAVSGNKLYVVHYIAPAPEPASASLLGFGALLLAARRRST